MGVRQPGMKREERHLDRKGKREGEKEPALLFEGKLQRVDPQQVEGQHLGFLRVARGQINDRDEHQEAARHRVDDELERGVDAPRAAPYADEKIHRHQHDFPKNVEKKKIQRDKGAEHAGLQ